MKETIMKTTITMLSLSLALAGYVPASLGYSYDSYDRSVLKAYGETLRIRGDSDDFPSGGARRDALSEAINRWNDNPSDFQFTLSYERSVGFGNLQSEIWFTGSDYWLDGAPAVCYGWGVFRGSVWNLFEADILVDDDRTWETSDDIDDALAYDYGNDNFRSLQTVFLHELGHALGLNHEDRYYNIMGQDWDFLTAYDGEVDFYAGEDACNGAVAMYGRDASAQREDVSVTHWKYCGADSDGYSIHRRCRVYRANDTVVDIVSGTDDACKATGGGDTYDDPIFEVSMSHTIKVELTFENSGYTYSVSPHVSYYLSTDDDIDGSDTVLATRRPTINRNTPYTFTQEMVVPTGLTSGNDYYILVFVDDQYEISEVNGANNRTYVRIRIK